MIVCPQRISNPFMNYNKLVILFQTRTSPSPGITSQIRETLASDLHTRPLFVSLRRQGRNLAGQSVSVFLASCVTLAETMGRMDGLPS